MASPIDPVSRSSLSPPSSDAYGGAPAAAGAKTPVLLDPQLTSMINGADIGTAIAAMVILSAKEDRKAARASRDASYDAMESAENTQIEHMKDAANDKLIGGISSGVMTLASAGVGASGDAAGAKALDAEGKLMGAVSDFGSSSEDAAAKDAGNAAARDKHVAESASDDVKDSDDVIKKAMDFMKEWSSAKDAAAAASVHRV